MRKSAVATGPIAGAAMRVKRNEAPQIAASSRSRAQSLTLRLRASFTAALFDLQQALLDRQPPGVAAEAAVGAHGAMAWHHQRDGVGAAGAADRAHRGRRADGARDFRIGARLAARDASQLFPHATLEDGAADVDRQAREAAFAGDEAADLRFHVRQGRFAQLRLAELAGEQLRQLPGIGAELDGANAILGGRDQHDAERRRERRIADALALAARAIGAGMHAKVALLIEARHRAVARVEHGVGHAAAVAQRRLHGLDAVGVLIAARGDPEGSLETPLQVKRACTDRARQLIQRHAFAAPLVQVPLCLLQPTVHASTVSAIASAFYPDFALKTYLREVRGSRPVRSATAA